MCGCGLGVDREGLKCLPGGFPGTPPKLETLFFRKILPGKFLRIFWLQDFARKIPPYKNRVGVSGNFSIYRTLYCWNIVLLTKSIISVLFIRIWCGHIYKIFRGLLVQTGYFSTWTNFAFNTSIKHSSDLSTPVSVSSKQHMKRLNTTVRLSVPRTWLRLAVIAE